VGFSKYFLFISILVSVAVQAAAGADINRTNQTFDSPDPGDGNDPFYYLEFLNKSATQKVFYQFFQQDGRTFGRFCALDAKNRPFECVGILPDENSRTCKTVRYDSQLHTPTKAKFDLKDIARENHYTKQDFNWAKSAFRDFNPTAPGSSTEMSLLGAPVSYVAGEDLESTLSGKSYVQFHATRACNIFFQPGGVITRYKIARAGAAAKANPVDLVAQEKKLDAEIAKEAQLRQPSGTSGGGSTVRAAK
jgi:hypothetical protein